MPIDPEKFPAAFDPAIYRALNSDLRHLSGDELREHYERTGRAEGRRPHAVNHRDALVEIVSGAASVLEIGPSTRPMVTGGNVRYFDVTDQGENLRRKGLAEGEAATSPRIDYVSPTGDLSIVPETFDAVISSHAIEHQPDLAGHLQAVGDLLNPGGFYVVMAPDKRYCFDHFIPESSIGDVMEAALERRTLHSIRSLVNQSALTTHNQPGRHWAGDHGGEKQSADAIEAALELYLASTGAGTYVDRHAWQFTDASFESILSMLNELGLVSLPVHRLYPTMAGRHEFWAVLGPKPAAGAEPRAAARARHGAAPAGGAPAAADPAAWGVDSVQPQPNMVVVRGWSADPPKAAALLLPDRGPVAGTVRACRRREAWAALTPEQREAGFIAAFPLEETLGVDQFAAARFRLERNTEPIEIPVREIGQAHRRDTARGGALLRQWLDSIQPESRVLEIGARSRTSQSLRGMLKGSFVGIDFEPGDGVDVVADAHLLADSLPEGSFTHALSASGFEHLFCPLQAVSELNAVLEPGGLAYIHCHQAWGVHEEPWDFFRFSDSAWLALFNEVTGFEVIGTVMTEEAMLVPVTEWGNPALYQQSRFGRSYQGSTVLARKTGPCRLPRMFSAEELKRVYPGSYPR